MSGSSSRAVRLPPSMLKLRLLHQGSGTEYSTAVRQGWQQVVSMSDSHSAQHSASKAANQQQ